MDHHRWSNYSSCCRLCLDDKMGSLRSIFEDVIRGQELVQQIFIYIGIQVKAGDKLTTMICEQCLSKVHMWNTFKKSCFENQEKLEGWMNTWETNNISSVEIQIKQEMMLEQTDEIEEPMEEDDYDEPPSLSPQLTENDPLKTTEESLLVEREVIRNQISPVLNGAVVSDPNRTLCSFCDKDFSNPYNRRRHERQIHMASLDKKDSLTTTVAKNTDADVQKIEFAAGLQLKRRSSNLNTSKSVLTDVEIAYLEKFKNIITMADTLVCVCHDQKYDSLKELYVHLKSLRTWFAMYTCYNCLISFCDRGSYLKHYAKCTRSSLCNLKELSQYSTNSDTKVRIYQNFKCIECNIIFSFYEDFCNHVNDNHMEISEDSDEYECACSQSFGNAEELKQHMNVSCFMSYYCDACFTSHDTMDLFKKHSEVEHDLMDGSSLDLYDYYHKSKVHVKDASDLSIQKERRISTRRRTLTQLALKTPPEPAVKDMPKPRKVINPHAFRNMKSTLPADCPECDKSYSSYHNMVRHYKIAHDEKGLLLACTHCSERFRLPSELKEHNETAHEMMEDNSDNEVSNFICPDCKYVCSSPDEWKKHVKSHPKQACDECGAQFNLIAELEQHKNVHLNIKVYRDSETKNYKSIMPNSSLNCSICEVTFTTKENFLQHKSLHEKMPDLSIQDENSSTGTNDNKNYSCTPCNKDFPNSAGLVDHNKRYHPNQAIANEFPKQCPQCDKVLLSRGAYGNHKRMHDRLMGLLPKPEETPKLKPIKTDDDSESYYTCKKCFKVFSSKSNLKSHMKSHGININNGRSGKALKTYWCDICHQACLGYNELQEHKQEHRQVKPKVAEIVSEPDLPQQANPFIFACDICSASFSTSFALKRHREKHDQEDDKQSNTAVYCKYCKIPFSTTEQWNDHMNSEHEENFSTEAEVSTRRFSCKICKKLFNNASALSSHQGWHKRGKDGRKVMKAIKLELPVPISKMDLKTYQCPSCALQFVNETALQIHILETHRNITRVAVLSCTSCRINFDSKTAYDSHMQLHKVVENQQKPTKPFLCTYCPARFNRKDRLRGHIKLHHSECEQPEVFKCTQCERSFDKQTALFIHLKVHERYRLVSSSNDVPKSKSKSVSDKNMYFCSICDTGFAIPKDLRTHVITAHPF